MNLLELKKVQAEVEERRKAEEEAKKQRQRQSNTGQVLAHFKEEKDGLWLIVKVQVQATPTEKGNLSLHNSVWRKIKTHEGIDIVIPSFNPFIPMK